MSHCGQVHAHGCHGQPSRGRRPSEQGLNHLPRVACTCAPVMSCHVMSCHVMSCHVMSCHVMSCHVMSCHVLLAGKSRANALLKLRHLLTRISEPCSWSQSLDPPGVGLAAMGQTLGWGQHHALSDHRSEQMSGPACTRRMSSHDTAC